MGQRIARRIARTIIQRVFHPRRTPRFGRVRTVRAFHLTPRWVAEPPFVPLVDTYRVEGAVFFTTHCGGTYPLCAAGVGEYADLDGETCEGHDERMRVCLTIAATEAELGNAIHEMVEARIAAYHQVIEEAEWEWESEHGPTVTNLSQIERDRTKLAAWNAAGAVWALAPARPSVLQSPSRADDERA